MNTAIEGRDHCGRCGGNGYLMRVHDKAMVKCDRCDGGGYEAAKYGQPCDPCGVCGAPMWWYVPHTCQPPQGDNGDDCCPSCSAASNRGA